MPDSNTPDSNTPDSNTPDSNTPDSNLRGSWNVRVASYLDGLEETLTSIDQILRQTNIDTSNVDAAAVQEALQPLVHALTQLEEKVAHRETLLRAEDAPGHGMNLKEKLQSTLSVEDGRLAGRCEQLAEMMADVHAQAISIFVCQYHLADLSGEIIRLMTGSGVPPTYQATEPTNPRMGGGLFNESA